VRPLSKVKAVCPGNISENIFSTFKDAPPFLNLHGVKIKKTAFIASRNWVLGARLVKSMGWSVNQLVG
jgi:hypothetical protein